MLWGKRDEHAAKRFFKQMMRADHRRLPVSLSVDKHASYPDALTAVYRVIVRVRQQLADSHPILKTAMLTIKERPILFRES